jgi:hypothetical protein
VSAKVRKRVTYRLHFADGTSNPVRVEAHRVGYEMGMDMMLPGKCIRITAKDPSGHVLVIERQP